MITQNARTLVTIIAQEAALQYERESKGHIGRALVIPCLMERLKAKSKSNVDLKIFLETLAFIPQVEDEGKDFPWAEDPREGMEQFVSDGHTIDRDQVKRNYDLGTVPADVHTPPERHG
jgi:hypothetical protein